jgi:hypothetical protein
MVRRSVWALVLLAVPSVTWAQSPDRFLPPGSQIYFRWDGFEAHRADFDKTAVGKMMKGDTGKFLSALVEYIGKQIDTHLGQFDPQAAQIVKDVGTIIDVAGKHGFTFAVEIKDINPPDVQAAFVLSKNGENVVTLLKAAIVKGGGDVKETRVGQATVYHVQPAPGLHLGWMNSGGDFVFLVGTHDPVKVAKVPAKKIVIAANPMYKEVTGFKEFPTWCRGYLDIAGIAAVVKKINPDVKTLVEELGIDGIKSITFQSGFDGPAERSVTELTTQGPRKGLLKLASTKTVSLKDLPPMPDDITSFSISSLNLAEMYDAVVQSAESAVKIFAPNEAAKIKEVIKQAEGFIGVKLRDDLLASLGDVCVTYNSPAEGLLGMGAVTLVKVKDGKKLASSLDGLFKTLQGLAGAFGADVSLKKKTYEGVDLFELHANAAGNFTLPTYTIHKGWFVRELSATAQRIHSPHQRRTDLL